ncbi:hypothetical protein BURPS1106B_0927 [Burkholderia pseudomallei 1106b]|nr:hypothetical protein BURPS1106B_0927 [Burkholderia pseudomallei 1106b]
MACTGTLRRDAGHGHGRRLGARASGGGRLGGSDAASPSRGSHSTRTSAHARYRPFGQACAGMRAADIAGAGRRQADCVHGKRAV